MENYNKKQYDKILTRVTDLLKTNSDRCTSLSMNNNYAGILSKEEITSLQDAADKILKGAIKKLNPIIKMVNSDLSEYVLHSEKKLNFHPDVPIVPLIDGEFGHFTNSYDKEREVSQLRMSPGRITSNHDFPVVPSHDGELVYFKKN